jgi:hypothetical protein
MGIATRRATPGDVGLRWQSKSAISHKPARMEGQARLVFPAPWNDFVGSLATGAVGGGVFTWLTKLTLLSGVIREELETVVYGSKHLATRTDKVALWRNVTQSLYGDRFPDLRDKITSDALKNVMPSERRFYVSNGSRSIAIRLLDKDKGLVEIETIFDADLITDGGADDVIRESEWTFRRSAVEEDKLEAQIKAQCSKYQRLSNMAKRPAFAAEIVDEPQQREELGNDEIRVRYRATLKPNSRYRVQVRGNETQLLGHDNVICFVASSYIDGLDVHLKTGPGLTTQFHPLGQANFTERAATKGERSWENRDLLFSDAGFLISIQLSDA